MGFEWVHRAKPVGIQVMNGSLKQEGNTPALAVLVSRTNPVKALSIAQLARILGCPANPKQPVTWAVAGAQGAWAGKPIHAYVYDNQTGTGSFLQNAILRDADCWNWDIVREFKDSTHPDSSPYPAAEQTINALKHDPQGIAISTLAYSNVEVKPLAVSVPLTGEAILAGTYPLARQVYIYVSPSAQPPGSSGSASDRITREFLRFILSPEGQAIVEREGQFLPLSAETARQQLKLLQ
jgi:phosphate transport system substrate-binding protein